MTASALEGARFIAGVGLGVLIGAAGAVWLRPRMVGDSVQLWRAGREAARRAVQGEQ